MSKYQLLCLPYAGGNENSYNKLTACMSDEIEIVTVELPGKGKRIKEQPLTSLKAIVKEVAEQMEYKIKGEYAIYGHSMGALTAHALVRYLMDEGRTLPEQLFLSSYCAPAVHVDKGRKDMTEAQVLDHIKVLGGIPPGVLAEPKLLDIFLPILKADLIAVDSYRYEETENPYPVPITLVAGNEEKVPTNCLREWRRETSADIQVYRFEGGHFFIFTESQRLCNLINTTVQQEVAF